MLVFAPVVSLAVRRFRYWTHDKMNKYYLLSFISFLRIFLLFQLRSKIFGVTVECLLLTSRHLVCLISVKALELKTTSLTVH